MAKTYEYNDSRTIVVDSPNRGALEIVLSLEFNDENSALTAWGLRIAPSFAQEYAVVATNFLPGTAIPLNVTFPDDFCVQGTLTCEYNASSNKAYVRTNKLLYGFRDEDQKFPNASTAEFLGVFWEFTPPAPPKKPPG